MYIEYNRYKGGIFKKHFCNKECQLKYFVGENSPSWIKDRSKIKSSIDRVLRNSPAMRKWRVFVFNRDSFKCQCCGKSGGVTLNAHHIIKFSKDKTKIFDRNNGITLCLECHRKINGNEEKFQNYLERRVNYLIM